MRGACPRNYLRAPYTLVKIPLRHKTFNFVYDPFVTGAVPYCLVMQNKCPSTVKCFNKYACSMMRIKFGKA